MSLLDVENLSVFYGSIEALRGISLRVDEGEVVTLIGANGAGKSTTLADDFRADCSRSGARFRFAGQAIQGWAPHRVVKSGLVQVPEGREIFANLTVDENLQLAAFLAQGSRPRFAPIANGRSNCSREFASGFANKRARFPAASSRCWRLPGRSWRGRSC